MREGRSDADRADHDAERRAAPLAEPAGDDLHPRRVDPGERHTGAEAQDDDGFGRRDEANRAVDNRATDAARRKQSARVDGIREIGDRSE
jgi:hypothetical protein